MPQSLAKRIATKRSDVIIVGVGTNVLGLSSTDSGKTIINTNDDGALHILLPPASTEGLIFTIIMAQNVTPTVIEPNEDDNINGRSTWTDGLLTTITGADGANITSDELGLFQFARLVSNGDSTWYLDGIGSWVEA